MNVTLHPLSVHMAHGDVANEPDIVGLYPVSTSKVLAGHQWHVANECDILVSPLNVTSYS